MQETNATLTPSRFREDFPMLKQQVHGKPLMYFDSAATAQKPACVIQAITEFYSKRYGTVHRAVYELARRSTEDYQAVREKVRKFLNAAKCEEIVYTKGTTESINLVAHSFGKAFCKPGDEIIISEMEHHSNIVPWQLLSEERGTKLKVIPVSERGELDLKAFAQLLTARTRLVSLCHVSNTLGTVNPVKELIRMAHEAGAKVLLDGAQACPHLPVDVRDLNADFYAFSAHKAFGPTGIGILYGKESLLDAMPPYQGGGDMIDQVSFEKTTYHSLPLKFEAGTPMIAEVMGLGAALDYLEQVGMHNIQQWESRLLERATELLGRIEGIRILGTAPEKGAILSFVVEGVHPLDLGTMLDLQGVAVRTGHHCTQPLHRKFGLSGTTRASFAFYNTLEEVDRFYEILTKVINQIR